MNCCDVTLSIYCMKQVGNIHCQMVTVIPCLSCHMLWDHLLLIPFMIYNKTYNILDTATHAHKRLCIFTSVITTSLVVATLVVRTLIFKPLVKLYCNTRLIQNFLPILFV